MVGKRTEGMKTPNRLIHEKSPYLLQHAYNPVEWYPWCDEAFDRARREDKPVFLSIGYSTCHWCHVMARESFEDEEVARLLNETFVCVKVDREERPDIDRLYMHVCQMMTNSGGWPLTIIMTPERFPFFAATYIPKRSRPERMGMVDLVPRVKEMWCSRRDEITRSANNIMTLLNAMEKEKHNGTFSTKILEDTYERLRGLYDERFGGFVPPPKFPMPHRLLFLLRYWYWYRDQQALEMVTHTLRMMRYGGIYDHIGYGFHRYSTDDTWLVPHFEKMLYDQAMLAMVYVEAYQVTQDEFFRTTACEIFTYVLRDMRSMVGGFYSAEDAESEGEEGKYYLWTLDEIRDALGEEEAKLFAQVFHVNVEGNYFDPLLGKRTRRNILHMAEPLSAVAQRLGIPESSLRQKMAASRLRLFSAREKRVHPAKDTKILTDWNGLMVAALAKASRVFGDRVYLKAARSAANFILRVMRTPEGRLLHRYLDGSTGISAYVDDYAFTIWGLIECYEATYEIEFLCEALNLQDVMTGCFWDNSEGGFFFTPHDGEHLILRQKEFYDGALPSGNSVALMNLVRLARFTGNSHLESQAWSLVSAFLGIIGGEPVDHTLFLSAYGMLTNPSQEIVIVGKAKAEDTEEMLRTCAQCYLPGAVVLFISDENVSDVVEVAPFVKDFTSLQGRATAYICSNFTCHTPTTDTREVLRILTKR